MDDIFTVQVSQPIQHTLGDFAKDLLACSTAKLLDLTIHAIEAPTFTEFHGDGDGPSLVVYKGAIISTDVFRRTIFIKIQLSNNLLFDVRVRVGSNDLTVLLVEIFN